MKRGWLWLPLAAFAVILIVVAYGLIKPTDGKLASKMIGKPLPTFALPAAAADRPALARADFSGKPRLLNVFASWCVPCIAEAPVLAGMARQGVVIEGVAIRDKPADVDAFLAKNGNPYRAIGSDVDSSIQFALGSSGVPETFVIDAKGIIRHQHIGGITEGDVPTILAKLREAE
jgi:cytochrome c biogenesis protein CcmG, thiol:disulfide interchange protein DsbE